MNKKDMLEIASDYCWVDDNYEMDVDLSEEQRVFLFNKFSDTVRARIIRNFDRDWESRLDMEICTFVWEDKKYILVIEDQYVWYDMGMEEFINDVKAFELEAEEVDRKFI